MREYPEARLGRANRGRELWSGDRPENAFDPAEFQPASSPPDNREWLSDGGWFASRPHRLFRARSATGGVWLVRLRRQATDVYLRVFARGHDLPADADAEIAVVWFNYAYPNWPAERCRKWASQALRPQRGAS